MPEVLARPCTVGLPDAERRSAGVRLQQDVRLWGEARHEQSVAHDRRLRRAWGDDAAV